MTAVKKPTRMQLSWLMHIDTGKVLRIGHLYYCPMQIDNTRTRAQSGMTLNLSGNGWITFDFVVGNLYRVRLTEAGQQVLKENAR